MRWQQRTQRQWVCDLGPYRGVVERVNEQACWSAWVATRQQTYRSNDQYPSVHEAQQWVERTLEDLLRERSQQV